MEFSSIIIRNPLYTFNNIIFLNQNNIILSNNIITAYTNRWYYFKAIFVNLIMFDM